MSKTNRSGLKVMFGLIGMVKPLLGFMLLAIIMGTLGNLAAIFITIIGGYGILAVTDSSSLLSLQTVFFAGILLAVLRGILRYAEQLSNHYIAFKILAQLRHQVFASLRKLAPAKLDGSGKGNLIAIITSDIEKLEVFYAHTISPIVIAILTSLIMCTYIGSMSAALALLAMVFYLTAGLVIPVLNGRRGRSKGRMYREKFGALNTVVLDNLYGLDEILQYHQSEKRRKDMMDREQSLNEIQSELKREESSQKITTDSMILIAGAAALAVSGYLVSRGTMDSGQMLLAVIAIMSSFGPVAALSALSNNLNQTLASGDRVLDILQEAPVAADINSKNLEFAGNIQCKEVDFTYAGTTEKNKVLKNFSAQFEENRIYGIFGKSGCGKSTLLKLLMRFYETDSGGVLYNKYSVNEIDTCALRKHISYVTQETFLFQDTIENNIKVAKEDATREEVIGAAQKASIHEFIESLPNGYDTRLGELGDSLSGGEKQRLGIARAFLHGSKVVLLDEPTSNIDSLNEGLILKSLEREKKGKTIILVSHRKSTMSIADSVLEM